MLDVDYGVTVYRQGRIKILWCPNIILIIRRQFLTRRNTTEVITRARINAEADDLSVTQCLDTYQLGAVSGKTSTRKQLTDCLERMCCGNRFHSDGA